MRSGCVITIICLLTTLHVVSARGESPAPWPAPVEGFTPPIAGEHPRLYFRKSDVPALRRRARTLEGQAIIARCKKLMGIDGYPEKPYTLWHGAAAGFLYQVTGEQRYADLARRYVDAALAGTDDKDARYNFAKPKEELRVGPALAAVAMAYDLAFDGWDVAYRRKVCAALMDYNTPAHTLESLSLRPRNPNPISNHLALQTGGAGLTILAIRGDEGADDAKLDTYQQGVDRWAKKVLSEDFGEAGYFGEHAGPGVVASTWTFVPWLHAQRVCAGRDWVSTRSNAEWISLRFVMQMVPTGAGPMYTNPAAGRGGYGGDFLEQNGGHHAAYFSQGFGAIAPHHRPAMLWVYNHFVQPSEHKVYPHDVSEGEETFDAFSYPHRCMFAFVNWPLDVREQNPAESLPKVSADRRMGHYVFRNRWRDKDDIAVAVLFGARTTDRNVRRMMVWGLGQQMTFGNITPTVEAVAGGKVSHLNRAKVDHFQPAEDGSGTVSAGGNAVGVDYSRASGADALIVMTGPGATGQLAGTVDKRKSQVTEVTAGGVKFSILTLSATGEHPEPVVEGSEVVIGAQTILLDGTRIVFNQMAGPPKIRQ